jgi:hypothetical protein
VFSIGSGRLLLWLLNCSQGPITQFCNLPLFSMVYGWSLVVRPVHAMDVSVGPEALAASSRSAAGGNLLLAFVAFDSGLV